MTDKVIELMDQNHEILDDMVVKECNRGNTHIHTVRTGIPEGTWRRLYGGVKSTKSSTKQVTDSCGMLEALPLIDVDVIDKSGDPAGTLLSEHMPHLEGMRQQMESTLFYGDVDVYEERFMGLAPRYDNYARATPDDSYSDYNVIHGGSSDTDNTSVWLCTWSDQHLHMLYPKGSVAGLVKKDLGRQLVDADDSSGKLEVIATKYKWDMGLSVADWRGVGRICNIDVSALEAASSAVDLVEKMIKLSERVEGVGRKVWYMHPRVRTMLRLQILDKSNVNLTYDTVAGRRVLAFDEIPIRSSKKILMSEALVTQAS